MMCARDTDSPTIQQLVRNGVATLEDVTLSRTIDDYLTKNLPWIGYRIDWGKLPNVVQAEAGLLTDEELRKFFDSTTLSRHDQVAVLYAAREPSVRIGYADIPQYFDDLVFPTQICFFVGLDDGQPIPQDFVEYEGMTLRGFARTD